MLQAWHCCASLTGNINDGTVQLQGMLAVPVAIVELPKLEIPLILWDAKAAGFIWCFCEEHFICHDCVHNHGLTKASLWKSGRLGEVAALPGGTGGLCLPWSCILVDPAQLKG